MFDHLYENIGGKIKNLAKVIFVLGAIGSVATAVTCIVKAQYVLSFICLIAEALGALIFSWFIYGIGELIDKTIDNENNTKQIARSLAQLSMLATQNQGNQPPKDTEEKITKKVSEQISPAGDSLADKLSYALKFQTDDGMVSYLERMDDDVVKDILKAPRHLIRELVAKTLEEL